MKTSTLAATCLTLLIAAPDARADHRVYRTLDDLAFEAMHDVREARWEIHDHFDTSRDYEALLEDAGALTHALRDVQDAVYREDSPVRLERAIETAHDALMHFQEHADHSDFASSRRDSFRFRRGSYSYHPRTRHAGYVHVEELQRTLDRVDSSLHAMTAAMERAFGHHHHDGPQTRPDSGGGPFFDDPGFRGGSPLLPEDSHGSPLPPTLVPPGPSADTISFPLFGSGIRFRFD